MVQSPLEQKVNSYKDQQTVLKQYPLFFDWIGRISLNLSENRIVTMFFLTLFFILAFLTFPTWEGDYDMWWQFTLGKYYVTHHTTIVNHAIFSWTPANPDWHYNTWLGSTIVYLIYNLAGGFGLWLFQWGIFVSIFLFFISFLRSIKDKLDINAVTFILMIVIIEGFVLAFPKPELFTPLLFTVLVYVFFSVKNSKISPLFFYLYPILFIFWVNLHGGFIVGLVTLAILFVTESLNFIVVRRYAISLQALVHLGCSLILVCFMCLLNPYGLAYPWDTIVLIFTQMTEKRSLLNKTLINYQPIWSELLNPPNLMGRNTGWIMILILFLFIIITLVALKKKRFFDLSLLSLNPFFFYYGMNTSRACIFFPIFSFFTIFYTIEKAKVMSTVKRFTLISIGLFLCFGATVLTGLTEINIFNFFGMNLEETIPVKEVELIKKFNLPPPLFNDYLSGGYIMWAMYPKYKVFIDSREGPYDISRLGTEYTEIMNNPIRENIRKFNIKYPFRVALINLYYTRTILSILSNAGDEWRLLFLDRNAAILIHKSLMPSLSEDLLRSIDINPLKFRDVKNPETLFNLFHIYVNWASEYGEIIKDIYYHNVSNLYMYKKQQMGIMEIMIYKKKAMEIHGKYLKE